MDSLSKKILEEYVIRHSMALSQLSAKAFWSDFRVWVTLAIAVAAFIKSFFF